MCIYRFIYFFDRVFLCSPGYSGTHSRDQARLKLRSPSASASQVLHHYAQLFIYFICMCCFVSIPEEGIRSHGTTDIDNYELPCGCWELNSCPLEEQPMLTAKPSLLAFKDRILSCGTGWSRLHCLHQAALSLTEILLSLFHEPWDCMYMLPHLVFKCRFCEEKPFLIFMNV